jgi:DNA gyrase subunit A
LRHGSVVAAFPVAENDQIVLMTDGGQLLRCSVNDIRIGSRNMQGVRLVRVAEGERVVSVAHLADAGESDDDGEPSDGETAENENTNGQAESEPNESGDE